MNQTLQLTSRWIERASDWANPILVKEVRQSLKSRQFVITFLLLLAGSWVISTFGMLSAGDAIEYGSTGRQFFFAFYFVLAIAIFVVVPFGAYRSLLTERDESTYELLSITTLSPRQIVWGKLLAALVQLFIYYSAIAPFIAFTSLLEGFDLAVVTFVLVGSMLVSLVLSMAALMLSTLARQRRWQSLTTVGGLIGLVFILMQLFFGVGTAMFLSIPFDDPEFWWGMGITLAVSASYFVLMQQITTAQLTFESDNRSTGVRVTCAAQFWLFLLIFFGYPLWISGHHPMGDEVLVAATMAGIHWSIVGLFAVTEPDSLSRRVRRGVPRRFLLRALATPFLPGGSRGYLYVLLHLFALWWFVVGMAALWGVSGMDPILRLSNLLTFNLTGWDQPMRWATALCCYVIIYLGIAAAMGRWARIVSNEIQPAHVRVLAFIVFLAGCIAPYIPTATGLVQWRGYSLWYVSNPFTSLQEVERGSGDAAAIMLIVMIGALIALAVNFRAIKTGATDVLFAEIPPRRPEHGPAEAVRAHQPTEATAPVAQSQGTTQPHPAVE